MAEVRYSQIYFVNITVENDWGYHLESLWYGADTKNLALMIMDVMKSWYEPNKEVLGQSIRDFHEKLEEAADEENPLMLSFKELTGEMFHENGLKLTIQATNDLNEMYAFVFNESFEIFAVNGENPEDFNSIAEYIDYIETKCNADDAIVAALKAPDENNLMTAIYRIDIKYGYSGRHYIPQGPKA
jgi:hypothetical protein